MSGDNGAMRILVVEDDNGIAEGLRTNLRQRGYAVDVCDGVASAWSALRTEPFDAVLLDLGLPDGDGSELLQRLRGNTAQGPVWQALDCQTPPPHYHHDGTRSSEPAHRRPGPGG